VGTGGPKTMELTHSSFCPMRFPSRMVWPVKMAAPWTQGWKKPGFLFKNPAQCFFIFIFFLVFFCFFLYICPEERVIRVFGVSRILLGASRL
jgi:hypothetical protein